MATVVWFAAWLCGEPVCVCFACKKNCSEEAEEDEAALFPFLFFHYQKPYTRTSLTLVFYLDYINLSNLNITSTTHMTTQTGTLIP